MNNKVKIVITGKNPDYFLRELLKRNICFYHLEKELEQLKIIVDYSDYLKILEIKTTYKIHILERYGISKYKFLGKKYYFYIFLFLIGIFINIILSNIVFQVEVVHPNQKLVKRVLKDLDYYGLKKYRLRISYSKKEEIKRKILEKEKDFIEWMEIEENGTKYIVKVEERKRNHYDDNCNARSIISKKNAMILDIHASSGEIVKKINDYVTKGEVIISGFIYNKENIVSKRCSIGEVYGETWYKIKVLVPKMYSIERLLTDKKYGFVYHFFEKEINFPYKLRDFKKKEYNIIEDSIIPISFGFGRYQKKKIIKKKYTKGNVSKMALNLASNQMKKNLNKDEEILSKKVLKKTEKNSKIEVEVFLKVKENITDYLDISNVNIEEMNKKEE